MRLTEKQIEILKQDRIAAPTQPFRDSMIQCGIDPDQFTGAEMREAWEEVCEDAQD